MIRAISPSKQMPVAWKNGITNISLHDTLITDKGLPHLVNFPNLRALYLGPLEDKPLPSLTGAGLAALAGLTQLEILNIHRINFTDAELKDLLPFQKLQQLGLNGTKVTYEGLAKFLKTFKGLQNTENQLDVRNTAVTKAQAQALKKSYLPNCTILVGHEGYDRI